MDIRPLARELHGRFAKNEVLTYASAVGLQLLTAVVPLLLLWFLLLGRFGKQSVWTEQMAPAIEGKVSAPTFKAVDAVVEGLISGTHTGWLIGAAAIAIWEVSGAVRACMGALNRIFDLKEDRPLLHRYATSTGLGIAVGVCTLGSMLVSLRGGGAVDLGPAQPVWTVVRWLIVLFLLWLAIAALYRFAPNGHEPEGWISAGGVFVILCWIGASLLYALWITRFANYKTPFGTMIAILTLVGYLYVSAIVFLVGAQLDQLAIERARR
jgi:membrane protein